MPNAKCQNMAGGPSGNKTFHFRNYKLQRLHHEPAGPPYFLFNAHRINLTQNGSDIDVTATLRVNSLGYKTSSTADSQRPYSPQGVAPTIQYAVTFGNNGNNTVVTVPDLLTVPFECDTHNQPRQMSSSIAGHDANDAVLVCWTIETEYRIVECGSSNQELYGVEWYANSK